MHFITFVPTLLALFCSPISISARKPANSVLLSQVKSLTLHSGQKTNHRRVSALPQLTCVGGNAKGLYEIDVMRCKNAGAEYDTEDIQWTCQAELPAEFKLGSTEVICEGYDSAEDAYVLRGSCGVEYRLVLTPDGEERFGGRGWERAWKSSGIAGEEGGGGLAGMLFSIAFWALFIAIVGWFLYKIFVPHNNDNNRQPGGGRAGFGGYGGGGGPDDGHDDPPPPYTPRSPKSSSSYRANQTRSAANAGQGWRPGFWSGTAAGAAAGYLAGNRGGNARQTAGRYQNAQAGPSSWVGGGGGSQRPASDWGGGGGGSSSAGPSGTRYESTGFGGTRRR